MFVKPLGTPFEVPVIAALPLTETTTLVPEYEPAIFLGIEDRSTPLSAIVVDIDAVLTFSVKLVVAPLCCNVIRLLPVPSSIEAIKGKPTSITYPVDVASAYKVPTLALYQGLSVFTEATSAARVSEVPVVGM
jgi:hypothetical protein